MGTPKRRRFQFSLMSLFVVITITALSVGMLSWLRSQMEGELQTIDIGGRGETLIFQCANAKEAGELADQFDNEAFLASVLKSLGAEVKDTPFALYQGKIDNGFFIKCDFPRWGNADIHQAIDNAGREYVASHPTVVKFHHSP